VFQCLEPIILLVRFRFFLLTRKERRISHREHLLLYYLVMAMKDAALKCLLVGYDNVRKKCRLGIGALVKCK
jgi:hypothetical protein